MFGRSTTKISKTLLAFQCLYLVQVAPLKVETVEHIKSGSRVLLSCETAGVNCTWIKEGDTHTTIYRNGKRISPNPTYDRFVVKKDTTNCTLGINGANGKDSGTYVCNTDQGTTSHSITVEDPPQLIIYVNDQIVEENVWHVYVKLGDQLKVTCMANASDANIVTCLDFPLSHSTPEKHEICECDAPKLSTTETLQVNHKDGAIVCTAWDDSYLVNVHKLALHVQYVPECEVQLIKDVIDCFCEGNPPTQYYLVNVNGERRSNGTSYQLPKASPIVNISCTGVNSIGRNIPQAILYEPPEFDDPYATVFWIITCIIVTSVTVVILTQAVAICRKERDMDDEELKRNTEFNRTPYFSNDDSQTVPLTDSLEDRL